MGSERKGMEEPYWGKRPNLIWFTLGKTICISVIFPAMLKAEGIYIARQCAWMSS
jgi:hypothetical protein